MAEPLTDADLDAMQARADAATPGPWHYNGWDGRWHSVIAGKHRFAVFGLGELLAGLGATVKDNGEFCAYVRQDLPALVAEVRRLRAWLTAIGTLPDVEARGVMARDALAGEPPP